MVRAIAFVLGLVVATSLAEILNSNVNVAVVGNLDEYLVAHPEVTLMAQLEQFVAPTQSDEELIQINYRLGNGRINGDRLVGSGTGNQSFGNAQDVKLTLQYPKTGTGAVVTFVQVLVEQSSTEGQGYVTSGGIGQRQITVVIEAKSTLYFRYNSTIFGY